MALARSYGRRPGGADEFARLWAQIPAARQRSIAREIQDALRLVKASVEPASPHEPVRTTHEHAHWHPPGTAPDQSESGYHTHVHSHGKAPSTQHGPVPDADHGHDHEETPGEQLEPTYERPAEARGKHIRFERGQVRLLNSARQARLAASWERAARDAGVIK